VTTYIALLRGINVGGKVKLPMAQLRDIVASVGGDDVQTYIQSGNVVFTHAARSAPKLTAELEAAILAATGFDIAVMLRTAKDLAEVIEHNPYDATDPTKVHVVFLATAPGPGALDRIDAARFAPEEMTLRGRELYLYLPDGMGRAKLPPQLGKIGPKVGATARNWRTVLKLADLAAG
jgi:uncharacterized protein (DUF1697 family)